jgi:hypothetical protein
MLRRVVNLFACWRELRGSPQCVAVCKLLPAHFLCLWRERDDRCFKDRKRIMAELKSFFVKTLYLWTAALDFNFLSFHNFLNLFSFSSQVFLLYTPCVLGLHLLCF